MFRSYLKIIIVILLARKFSYILSCLQLFEYVVQIKMSTNNVFFF